MKMSTIILSLIITILFCSCNNGKVDEDVIYQAGVSRQLAQLRKKNIENLEYEISFTIPKEKSKEVTGTVSVCFEIDAPQEIILDFREEKNINGVTVNGETTLYRVANEHIIIPGASCVKGKNNVTICFTADNQSLNRHEDYLYTLLVPDRARTLFPCFDQPDLKAKFTLTLNIPKEWIAVSNSTMSSREEADGQAIVTFNATEQLSTYLFSFVAGKFENRVYDKDGKTFSAYYRETDPKKIAQLPIIFEQVAHSLTWMEEYTGVPYPFAKYDFVIMPGFQYGGMEHTGATLYNDTQLFLGEHPTPDEELGRAQLIAHETAHMWFGDLVTMGWFDDVWTKEVFANYFAMRITEPMFTNINHRLNWQKSIVTPALAEDRTAGGTAIKQQLDNMRNAGLIYNNIIYNKAPVMLEQLIGIMGEEAFREGIREYLTQFSYGNASWHDLIEIFDRRSEQNLAQFSDVWVNSNGMPHFRFALIGDTLVVRQNDPYNRGHHWQQRFNITLMEDCARDIEINMSDTLLKIAVEHPVEYILPNSDGRGYGFFDYDANSLDWVLHNWHTIEDETCRQTQLMNLHESYQHHRIEPAQWLKTLIDGLQTESNVLIISTICNYIREPLQEAGDSMTEESLLSLAESHPQASCRLQLIRLLITTATSPNVCSKLYDIWDGMSHPMLGENDYMTLAYELAIRYPEKHKEIVETQRARIKDPDRRAQFDFVARAVTPDTLQQEALFHSLLRAENRRIEPWAIKTLGHLCHSSREAQAIGYIRPALDALQDIQRTSDIFFPRNWVHKLLSEHSSEEALDSVTDFLNDNPEYPTLLKSKILQALWPLQRKLRHISCEKE